MGTPKHPLFLLGKKYSDADVKPKQATAFQPHAGSPRSRWGARKGFTERTLTSAHRDPANSDRVSTNLQSNESAMQNQPSHANGLPGDLSSTMTSSVSSLPSSSFSSCSSGKSSSVSHDLGSPDRVPPLPALQPDVITNHNHPISSNHVGLAHNTRPASKLQTDTHEPFNALPSRAALDLEAQTLHPGAIATPAKAENTGPGTGSDDPDQASSEAADVAAEHARVEQLWAKRADQDDREDTVIPPGPAILLRNLRKVCLTHVGKQRCIACLQRFHCP